MAITLVECVTKINGTASTTVNLGTATTAGELMLIAVQTATSGNAPTTITDSGSQTYTSAWTATAIGGHHSNCLYYVANSASGITSVSLTLNTDTLCDVIVAHYKGVATASPLDVANTAAQVKTSGGTTTWTSNTPPTTTNANDLLIGVAYGQEATGGVVLASNSPWTQEGTISNDSNGDAFVLADQIVSSTGTYGYSGTVTSGTVSGVFAGVAAFAAAAGGGGATFTGYIPQRMPLGV